MFNVPSSPTKYEYNLKSFMGVDFSSSMSEIDTRRSPNGYNFINENGTIKKRNGYKILAYLGQNANINGIWNVDTLGGEYFIIHCGTKLYEMKTDFSRYTEILTGMADNLSQGIVIGGKLLILDGKRAVVYDLLVSTNKVNYLDNIGYIPITEIARSPNGSASQSYEKANLLQESRINLFISNATDTVYHLADKNIKLPVMVEVMDSNGIFQAKVRDNDYTVNYTNGTITFKSVIGEPPVDGRDNVRIKYSVDNTTEKAQINKCNILTSYGYGGSNDRVFMSGNSEYQSLMMWSEINDITYFSAKNVMQIGLATIPITGFTKLNSGKLAVLKDVSDTDSTMFRIGYATYNSEQTFSLEGSSKGEGNISMYANDTLINEPLILTQNGVFAINSATINDERFAYHRSFYVDRKLLSEKDLKNAIGIVNDGKYYLAINNNVYVADSRFKTSNKNSKYSNYQYEWFYWTDIPVRTWFRWNNKLYFGDKYGNICTFRDNNDSQRYLDIDKSVKSYWSSCILDFNNLSRRKNIKKVFISSNPTTAEMNIGYITKNREKNVLDKLYINSEFPKITAIRKQAKKLSFISLYVENSGPTDMSFNEITVVYTIGSFYKGD